jgi:glycosyltransferase involved in cell wall biosynthesis
MSATPAISVIIPTYNKARYLDLTLASWCHQRCDEHELIVIVDGATDDSPEVIAAYAERLPLRVVHTENGGRAAARNRGLAVARGEYVVFSDDDRLVAPQFLAAHVEAQRAADPTMVGIGWQYGCLHEVRPAEPAHPAALARALQKAPGLASAVAAGASGVTFTAADVLEDGGIIEQLSIPEPWFTSYLEPALQRHGEDISASPLAWSFGTTGNLCVPRAALERVGGFDERFRNWGLEDAELHYRLVAQGARTRLVRGATNYHLNHPRDESALKWSWLRNAALFLDKHAELDVALYIQAEVTNLPLAEVEQILREARSLGDSRLVRAYRNMVMNHARQITGYSQML